MAEVALVSERVKDSGKIGYERRNGKVGCRVLVGYAF